MKSLRCLLGRHDWYYRESHYVAHSITGADRVCLRCKRRQTIIIKAWNGRRIEIDSGNYVFLGRGFGHSIRVLSSDKPNESRALKADKIFAEHKRTDAALRKFNQETEDAWDELTEDLSRPSSINPN